MPTLPLDRELSQRLREGFRRFRQAGRRGVAVARILARAGLALPRPDQVPAIARRLRAGKIGPELAIMLQAHTRPDRLAVADARRRLTYAAFEREINRLAHALASIGVRPGDRVAVMLPNSVEYLVAFHALPALGATVVQVGVRLKSAEIGHILANAAPRAMIYARELAGQVVPAIERSGAPGPNALIVVDGHAGASEQTAENAPGRHWDDLLEGQPDDEPPRVGAPDAGGVIYYTSGTTGKPKGAMRTFSQTGLDSVADLLNRIDASYRDRHLIVCPLYHSAAHAFAMILLSVGASIFVMEHFDPEGVLAAIEREAITSAFLVPTQILRLTALEPSARARHDTSSLRWVLSGAAPLPTDTARRFQESFGPILWNFYGATETGLVTLAEPADHAARPGTVGRAMAGNQIRILDADGNQVPTGEVGELVVRNSTLIGGYHRDREATREAMRGEFFSVGDLARVDADGYVYLASRVHDMVISGGVNIYPAEIEEHLHGHPDILEASVVGVPDAEWGERLKAFVVARPGAQLTADDVIRHCREGLADYKRPREVVFMDALPRNPTGKVLKRELRAL